MAPLVRRSWAPRGHTPVLTQRGRSPRKLPLALRLGVVLDAELLDLARDGVAPHAEQIRRFDAPAAGAPQRLQDERALELPAQIIKNSSLAAREPALGFLQEPHVPRRHTRLRHYTHLHRYNRYT